MPTVFVRRDEDDGSFGLVFRTQAFENETYYGTICVVHTNWMFDLRGKRILSINGHTTTYKLKKDLEYFLEGMIYTFRKCSELRLDYLD